VLAPVSDFRSSNVTHIFAVKAFSVPPGLCELFPLANDEAIEREAIVFGGKQQDKKQQGQSGNHVFVERIKRFLQKVAEGNDYEDEAQCDKRFAYP
jgi:hypothetical protein